MEHSQGAGAISLRFHQSRPIRRGTRRLPERISVHNNGAPQRGRQPNRGRDPILSSRFRPGHRRITRRVPAVVTRDVARPGTDAATTAKRPGRLSMCWARDSCPTFGVRSRTNERGPDMSSVVAIYDVLVTRVGSPLLDRQVVAHASKTHAVRSTQVGNMFNILEDLSGARQSGFRDSVCRDRYPHTLRRSRGSWRRAAKSQHDTTDS
jgi:hypothetical protein